jgi:hypothetical protein
MSELTEAEAAVLRAAINGKVTNKRGIADRLWNRQLLDYDDDAGYICTRAGRKALEEYDAAQ